MITTHSANDVATQDLEALLGSLSHDLRAPMRAIEGFSAALIEEYGSSLDETGHEYLGELGVATRRMRAMLDAIVSLYRSGTKDLHVEEVDVSGMAKSVAEELRGLDSTRAVEFLVAQQIRCYGDAATLRVALYELLANAWRFTAMCPTARIELLHANEAPAGMVGFLIRDNGPGFDPNDAKALFMPFRTFHSRDEGSGLGVGLAKVRRIVERNRGSITALGQPGRGAEFCVTLPAVRWSP